MRKANKIVMTTVAILLSAVLLTTSALSGTLAKYVTSAGSYSDSARVAKWGVTVDAKVSDELLAATGYTPKVGTENTWQQSEITVDLGEFSIKPGDYYADALSFTFNGTAEVKLEVRFYVDMDYLAKNFQVKKEISGYTETDEYMPVGFKISASDTKSSDSTDPHKLLPSWYTGYQGSAEGKMSQEICNFIDMKYDSAKITSAYNSTTPGYVAKSFNPNSKIVFHPVTKGTYKTTRTYNEDINLNKLSIDLFWPIDRGNSEASDSIDFDAITAYYSSDATKRTVSAKFKIVIVQVNN